MVNEIVDTCKFQVVGQVFSKLGDPITGAGPQFIPPTTGPEDDYVGAPIVDDDLSLRVKSLESKIDFIK